MNDYAFFMTMEVRNYECDLQGIVNNAVYQNYLAHARHEFLKHKGIDFVEYARQGINLVVIRAELDYKQPLTAGDRFVVGLDAARESKARFAFYQDIYRAEDERLALKAKIIGTALDERGRPSIPKQLAELFV
uniref:Acyl-CoA thioester hydrolase n=1 Tax=Candidatus Kentrum sp. LPFa TaxID=2126335 RepID=A0A450WB28_9GAMM|nr:MAG: acyl-CoA thioester hydrolase [Candidatus Kentron sp. LPFa]VFK30049.1 MAG: acyl-CoA thioester hydrolase [Candidatus Kentron sp. LPFa]